ncbi:MAG: VOC family protein [Dehalococcoidia bacterium]
MKVKNLGHVVLRVRDAEASARWYEQVLGLHVTYKIPGRMVFLSSRDDTSHELALMSLGPNAAGPSADRVGLYHIGWQLESLEDLTGLRARLEEQGVRVAGIGDHGISLGVYVFDPDGNELEFFYELPPEEWPSSGDLFTGHFPKPVEV